ncbi:MarR family transcriptional regulator [Ramlibacter sp. H39-3-26]|uniref:MarR family winged helix-turn-helix transcriptional regulator n=1 Tax=Curvibacter soli TaxID=3031331 RepID=UPI0023DAF9C3|nr:MarR family transcriptional regulator [Ramlibacter sp. H39-3-26]MDF1485623.1 MarR family transcriptional regulator [Ramlibacter sp. H39-3-26]
MMKRDFSRRFGFLVNDVAKLYGEQFDRLARERMGLTRAQLRLLGALSRHDGPQPLSQAELAQRLDLSAMAVATLCDRMEAAGWLRREPSPHDRRAKWVRAQPPAEDAIDEALALGDAVQARALACLSAAERSQLTALLGKARQGLLAWRAEIAR